MRPREIQYARPTQPVVCTELPLDLNIVRIGSLLWIIVRGR